MNVDQNFMRQALVQAGVAASEGEVPVGAVVVKGGVVVGVGRNAPRGSCDPTAHAEIAALRAAALALGNYRLDGCDLYVTLEPCAMCAGAMLHARLRRVIFGAPDLKTGAAGSVLNLFDQPAINHQTQLQGGVLQDDCAALLAQFFQARRAQQRALARPLREEALRTPDERFADLPDYPWPPNYVSDLAALNGLRMHYLDVGQGACPDGRATYLCLHGNPSWSFIYRKMIPVFANAGHRVVVPDLIGFGKSDKPKRENLHSFTWHRQVLLELIERLDLQRVVMVVQDWGGLIGLTLPMDIPERISGLLVMNTTLACGDEPLTAGFLAWRAMCAKNPDFDIARLFARANPELSAAECAAYNAPFPDGGYRAALRKFPAMVPEQPDDDGAALSRRAREFLRNQWRGKTFMAIGVHDPVLGVETMNTLRGNIANCPAPMLVQQAGHFVPEQGAQPAQAAVAYFAHSGSITA